MISRLMILVAGLAGVLWAGEPTNLIEVLRKAQRDLDEQEARARAPQQTSRVAATEAASAVVPVVHLVAAGDVVRVTVINEPDMSLERGVVSAEGTVELPKVGAIRVANLSVAEAAASIQALLARDYLVNPKVSVELVEASKREFTIRGQVLRPGVYQWGGDAPLTLLKAIGMAGGAKRVESLSRVTVERVEDGKTVRMRFDLSPRARDVQGAEFLLKHGDVVDLPVK